MTAVPTAGPGVPSARTAAADTGGRWTRPERARIGAVAGVVALLHVLGWSGYLYYTHHLAAAGGFAGAGTLAYALGVRHAFDADHIAAIDDTTRVMLARGRRPVGVGFFFSVGHSSVVVALCLVVAVAAGAAGGGEVRDVRHYGGVVGTAVAAGFLLLVAGLNASVLHGLRGLWRRLRAGDLDERELDAQLAQRGLVNRLVGRRAQALVRSSWHMLFVGLLFGLGLETASEVTLLALSASTARAGSLPVLAVLTLPLLFAAGMSALDTADSLLMTRAYSWAYRSSARRLYYNLATTGMTVAVGLFIASVQVAGLLADHAGVGGPVAAYASVNDHLELLGYVVVGVFLGSWAAAALWWRLGGLGARYGAAEGSP